MSLEFLQVAEAVAREKGIEKEDILQVMENAIAMGVRRKYGLHLNVHAAIDRISGELVVKKLREVVTQVMEPVDPEEIRNAQREGREPEMRPAMDSEGKPRKENDIQILQSEAQKSNANIQVGEFIQEDLPEVELGRIAAQSAKQVIFQGVRSVERAREFIEYKDSVGTVVSGIVKKADYKGVTIDLGKAEAFMPRDEMIPRESYRQNDRVRAYIYKVEESQRGAQIWLSRTHPKFLMKLFAEEVPEIQSGTIEILNAARDPGFRAKIAVKSYDRNLDPVGACVGIRGIRVQAVTAELQGERVDIINWSADPVEFLVRAMAPADVTKVVMDEAENRMEVIVPEDKLSLAIGRRGQNVQLASRLTGYNIDVMTEAEESERRTREYEALTNGLIEKLDVDDTLARLLISEGFALVEDLLQVSAEELGRVEGLDTDIAAELQRRATECLENQTAELKKMKVADDLLNFEGLPADLLLTLAKQGVKTLDDFADLATDELLEMANDPTLTKSDAENMIMAARQHWFDDETDEEAEAAEAQAASA
jgi:N utilization substance protein A